VIRAAVAQGWGAPIAKACGMPFPDCNRCRRPESEELRKAWGCDAPTGRVVWRSSCPRCADAGVDCERCGGSGTAEHHRCPSAMLRKTPQYLQVKIDLLMRAYSHYDRRNVLPVAGAWLDQSRSFLAGVDLIDAERGFWERIRNDHDMREMERTKAQSQMSARQGRRR